MKAFVAEEAPLVVGVDETLDRRRARNIEAKVIYRDPVRSSHSHFIKTSALRWVCVTLLAEIPWASRVLALPFLSALAPSERNDVEHGKRHKSITERVWQLLLLIRRWHPGREIVAVADGGYASLKLRAARREALEMLNEELARGLRWPRRALELLKEEAREAL